MERIEALINKLKDQFEQRMSPAQLQMTVQLLQNELAQHQANGAKTLGTSKVAVVLPSASGFEQYAPPPDGYRRRGYACKGNQGNIIG